MIQNLGDGWQPEIRQQIQQVIDLGSKRVKKGKRAVAVFDFDDTCIWGDVGRGFAHFMTENLLFRYDMDAFWKLFPEEYGRDELRDLLHSIVDTDDYREKPSFHQFLCRCLGIFTQIANKSGTDKAIEWALKLHVGISELDLSTFSLQLLNEEIKHPLEIEVYDDGDGYQRSIPRGIRPYEEVALAMRAFEKAGFEVWVVSATNFWTVSNAAAKFGIPDYRVLGNRLEVDAGILTSTPVEPILYGKGKKEAIKKWIQERPLIVFGDSITDFDMLKYAKELAVLIYSSDDDILKSAKKYKWAIQPASQLKKLDSFDKIPREPRFVDPFPAPPIIKEKNLAPEPND